MSEEKKNTLGRELSANSSNDSSQLRAAAEQGQREGEQEEAERQKGFFGRLKANFKAQTRSGRIEAQNAEIAAEKKRQREMDPTPFPTRAFEYGELFDPKSVKLLQERGGIEGLLRDVGTHPTRGLDLPIGAGGAAAEQPPAGDAQPSRELGGDKDLEATADAVVHHKNFVNATAEDRERVYGANKLPERKGKSLLLLMWLTFQDKILVSQQSLSVHNHLMLT